MGYFRCECGKKTSHLNDMGPFPCQGCDECGTTAGRSEESRIDPVPHRPMPVPILPNAEQIWVCRVCHELVDKDGKLIR